MKLYRLPAVLIVVLTMSARAFGNGALQGLMERIDSGLSEKITVRLTGDQGDFFELSQSGDCPQIVANNVVSGAVGLNWYLKYVAGVHLSWGNMHHQMPAVMPSVDGVIRHECRHDKRYYLNYCTHSYSMAFWGVDRWEEELDWMALHGINMPLVVSGAASVWRGVLEDLGYGRDEIDRFVAGPAYQAWWLMNNLEGWGGGNDDAYYARDLSLAKWIVARAEELGMTPVVAGYGGMVPSDARSKLKLDVKDPGLWCGFRRPAFLQPEDPEFDRIADLYYKHLAKVYGKVVYLSADPFHEGGDVEGVDMRESGRRIMSAMKRFNGDAVWVVQGWQENPRRELIADLEKGDVVILDLQSENAPSWGLHENYCDHERLYCMLLNFGGNVGLYGKMDALMANYWQAVKEDRALAGIGLTMEGIENNPVMYELLCELPWHEGAVDRDRWVAGYASARYGQTDSRAEEAWRMLGRTVYNCGAEILQQGTVESLFCARPSDAPRCVSAWADSKRYYDSRELLAAAELLAGAADSLALNRNYQYDLVDIVRQCVADRGREVMADVERAFVESDSMAYRICSEEFLRLIDLQDSLLATIPSMRVDHWIGSARKAGSNEESSDRNERNARALVTVWGPREASDGGRLHDYSHREWAGLLSGLYRERWRLWFDSRLQRWPDRSDPGIDFFAMEQEWVDRGGLPDMAEGDDPVGRALLTLRLLDNRK